MARYRARGRREREPARRGGPSRPAGADRRASREGASGYGSPTPARSPTSSPTSSRSTGPGGLRAPPAGRGDRRPPPRRRAHCWRAAAGKAGFLDLVDRTGKIQLHARQDVLGDDAFERLTSLDLGDLIGVDGAPLRSRRGELSLRVDAFEVLAKALRPPPDKHHGLSDVETRLRRRELDLIANEDDPAAVHRPRADHLGGALIPRRRTASSRSRRRSCSRSTAVRWHARSPPTTTPWTATCTCGSRPSCTSSA